MFALRFSTWILVFCNSNLALLTLAALAKPSKIGTAIFKPISELVNQGPLSKKSN
jgi:hypothetical protein